MSPMPMYRIVLLKALPANPAFQALQVPQELREYQALGLLWLVMDFLGDGNSVLGNIMEDRMTETMAKYM